MKEKITSLLSNIKTIHIVVFVVLIILIQVVWAYRSIITLNQSGSPQITIRPLLTQNRVINVISLVTPKLQFKVGEKVPINININSNKTTAGVDLIIHFDPNLLTVSTNATESPVAIGKIYNEYPVNELDQKNGLITVSGISSLTGGVIPNGVFGTILFQAKAAGNAKIFLEFTKNSTNDTNLTDSKTSTDVLEEVKNLDLKIIP